jgi:DNA-binding GntR family transcriptional regulator
MALQDGRPDFPQPKRMSLAESIADSIAGAIATRHLQPGERIVEMSLAERLGVSRVPIREGLKVLHAQGILAGGSHRGYRVADFGPDTAAKVIETRLMIETFLLRDAVAVWRDGREDPGKLDAAIRQMEIAAMSGDSLASLVADLDFHRTIRSAAHNEIAATLWDTLARHVLIIFNQDGYRDNDLNAVVRQHKSFRDAIIAWVASPIAPSADALRQGMEDHLLQIARRGMPPGQEARRPKPLPLAL